MRPVDRGLDDDSMKKDSPGRRVARLAAAWAYLRRSPVVERGPVELIVDATNRCNQACSMCRREFAGPPWNDFPFEVLRDVLADVGTDLSFLDFSQRGEPLLHPDLARMVAMASEAGVPTYVTTNATVLTDGLSRALIEAGLTLITFSLDAATPEVYRRVHGARPPLDTVEQNVEAFLALRGRRRPPHAMVQMVRLPENESDIEAFHRRWRHRADRVRVKARNDRAGLYAGPDEDGGPPVRTPCPRLWRGLAVLSDGRVVPCCYDVTGREVLGSISRDSIGDLWRGGRLRALRKAHLAGRRTEVGLCRGCRFPTRPLIEGLAFTLVEPVRARLVAGTLGRWLR